MVHGDPSAGSLYAVDERMTVAIDWATFGSGPVGADLGSLTLSERTLKRASSGETGGTATLAGMCTDGLHNDSVSRRCRRGTTPAVRVGPAPRPAILKEVTLSLNTGCFVRRKVGELTMSWPALEYEPHEWSAPEELSPARRERIGGTYLAAVPTTIATRAVTVDSAVAAAAEEAAVMLSRFDAQATSLLPTGELGPITSILLRSESAASSQIEYITVGARALAQAALGEEASANARLVDANVRTMTAAAEMADAVTTDAILQMHAQLLGGKTYAMPGHLRDRQVWIGGERGGGPKQADFVPPLHERVPALMDDLAAFIARDDVPALVHAAIAHAQFETIHPFNDGNGRVGRAVVHAMLKRAGVTTRFTVPISAGLLSRQADYISALTDYRSGDINTMVGEMAQSAVRATIEGNRLLRQLADIQTRWIEADPTRKGSAIKRLPAVLIEQPVVSVRYVQERLGVSFPTAQAAIDTYERIGALRSALAGRRRNRLWYAPEVTGALDDFAERSGRREY